MKNLLLCSILIAVTTTLSSSLFSDAYRISEQLAEPVCGTRPIRHPKIINGQTAVHGHYPWIVSLQLNNRHHCGGSLIQSDWVLTAAHCVYRLKANRFRVKLGGNMRNTTTESTSMTLNATKIIAHTGFSFATFADDVALVKLPYKVTYTPYIRPICLPLTEEQINMKHPSATVIGWGKLKQGGFSAETLQELELPLVENDVCQMWYRQQGKMLSIRPTQICAGLAEGGKDACQGDSGSPLLVHDATSQRSTVIGIVSAGIGCALPKLPGLYTRVTSYLDWIERTIAANQLDDPVPVTVNVNNNSTTTTTVPASSTSSSNDNSTTTMTTTIASSTESINSSATTTETSPSTITITTTEISPSITTTTTTSIPSSLSSSQTISSSSSDENSSSISILTTTVTESDANTNQTKPIVDEVETTTKST